MGNADTTTSMSPSLSSLFSSTTELTDSVSLKTSISTLFDGKGFSAWVSIFSVEPMSSTTIIFAAMKFKSSKHEEFSMKSPSMTQADASDTESSSITQ